MKSSIRMLYSLISLLLSISVLTACGDGEADKDISQTENSGSEAAADIQSEEHEDMKYFSSGSYAALTEGCVYTYTSSDGKAEFKSTIPGKAETFSGDIKLADGSISIGEKSFGYTVDKKKLILTDGDTVYELRKASADDIADCNMWSELISGSWNSDEGYLTFDSATGYAHLSIPSLKLDNFGSFIINTRQMTIKNEGNSNGEESIDYALHCTAEASSLEGDWAAAALAVDGDSGTRWSSQFNDPNWICLDLGEKRSIGAVRLNWENSHAKTATLEVSDDKENWTVIQNIENCIEAGEYYYYFTDVSARYIRMHGTERVNEYGYSMYDFEVYNFITAPDVTFDYKLNGDSLTVIINDNEYTFKKS